VLFDQHPGEVHFVFQGETLLVLGLSFERLTVACEIEQIHVLGFVFGSVIMPVAKLRPGLAVAIALPERGTSLTSVRSEIICHIHLRVENRAK
jgi:hypothetical protein